ncbi:hypothetical protein HMPREF1866_00401 [Lachnoanaerobaculum saburreum]|uniref:Phage tail assembly protein n=2 Tax=Lachnoanaerobaculum saburreum TaxID=467210 RepID=A0A133ZYZ6_9FIRM|nr:hypothetical protein HMPREF1866_00401 [Lachnoanaerobaculum saburreum]
MLKEINMADKNKVVNVEGSQGEVSGNDTSMIIKFSRKYTFEDREYEELDLSGLESMSATDMIAANKILEKSGSFSFLPEMSLEYACIISARATKIPLEFFKSLHPKDAIKVKNRVTSFFYGEG